uniref:CSON014291 protein n=1 Tax=Culicoides sonorensis TaxID=179676 RepID=A0A336MFX1_CULSO
MDAIRNGWFSEISEELWPGQCFSLKIKEVLHEEKSKYQDIKLVQTETYGRALLLDGVIQCTERDEFSYQEMISFLPLMIHPNPKKVLIIGGGDGGVAREVSKYKTVEEVHQCEIDDRVVELSKKYLPNMACGFESPKIKLTIGDGFVYMKNNQDQFDVIITDSSDPIGPAVSLFQESYFELMRKALKPGGIVCSQGGTYWLDLDHIKQTLGYCKKQFPTVGYGSIHVPSYPCGQIGFVIGSLDPNAKLNTPSRDLSDEEIKDMKLRYYSPRTHRAAFELPFFVEDALKKI